LSIEEYAMTPDVFAEWLRRQGYHVVRTPSSYWVQVGPRIYQAFPYHRHITPPPAELDQLLRQNRAFGLRYSTTSDQSDGMMSYHVVYEGPEYPLNSLSKKARYDVRKGLKSASVEPISWARLAGEGWALRAETLERQGRDGAESRIWWERLCHSAEDLPGFEAWAAIARGNLVASLVAFSCGNCCSILYQQSSTEYLRNGVNNALTYIFSSEVLRHPGITQIFYGLQSLDAPPSVDEFKFRMGYMAKPVRQRVVFHPWLTPFFNRASHTVTRQLLHWRPDNPMLAKAEGMLRFYLEGKRPLAEQDWPECLAGRKAEWLKGAGTEAADSLVEEATADA
jgi:hypothetical protein